MKPRAKSRALGTRLQAVECPAFSRRRQDRGQLADVELEPIVLTHGQGSVLTDADGNRYVDFAAGFGSVLLGHGAEPIRRAIEEQSGRLIQGLGDVYATDTKVDLLEKLAALHPAGPAQVLLGQSGSDAVSAAIKTATLATGRPGVLAFDGAYHGLGYGPLASCGFQASFRRPFDAQLNPYASFAPYPGVRGADMDASLSYVKQLLHEETTAAVLVEPVIGRGGCVAPPDEFLGELCALAHHYRALVIADEIWTGFGRCGAMVRSAELKAPVDIICFGKGLGGGLAISACVAPEPIMRGWARGAGARPPVIHTSTHVGAPLSCAAALATLHTLQAEQLPTRAQQMGQSQRTIMRERLLAHPLVTDVRAQGMMFGIELVNAKTAVSAMQKLLDAGYLVLTGGVDGAVLTLTPALNIAPEHFDGFVAALRQILDTFPNDRDDETRQEPKPVTR